MGAQGRLIRSQGCVISMKNKAFIITLVVLAVGLPGLAAAQFPSWQVPSGGETWTAGSSHTLRWSGGTATVFGLPGRLVRTLVEEQRPRGSQEDGRDGRDASGRETARLGLVR